MSSTHSHAPALKTSSAYNSTPTLMSSSTTHSTSSPSPSVSSTPSNAGRIHALEAGLAIVTVLLIIATVLFVLHLRRNKSVQRVKSDPIPHITPFGSTAQIPRYGKSLAYVLVILVIQPIFAAHIPGLNMRIATRDLDGSWQIADSRTPFTPSGVSELSPSPSSSTFRLERTLLKEKEAKAKSFSSSKGGGEFDMVPGLEYLPPPAYGYGYSDHTKSP
jgi:hypothetical protein